MLTVEQFKAGLTENRRSKIEEFIDDSSMPQFTSWEQILKDFGRPHDRHAWRIFSRVIESFHPERITQDQLSLFFVWRRAFQAEKIDIFDKDDPLVTKAELFRACKSKESFSDFVDTLVNTAGALQIRLPSRGTDEEQAAEVSAEDLAQLALQPTQGEDDPFK